MDATGLIYYAYGSNLHPGRLTRRIAGARLLGTARLADWSLNFDKVGQDGSGKCNIVPGRAGQSVCLAAFRLIEQDRERLDAIEGLGRGYRHQPVATTEFGNGFAYVAEAGHIAEALRPFEWYKEYVLAGCEYHGFAESYRQPIRRIAHRADDDASRHARHMRHIAALRRRGSR